MIHETLHDEMERDRRYNYPGGAATVTITLEEYRDLLFDSFRLELVQDKLDEHVTLAGETAKAAPRARLLSLAEADDAPIVWLHSQTGYTQPGRVTIMQNGGIMIQRFGQKDVMLQRSEWGRVLVAFDTYPSEEDTVAIQWLRPGQEAQDD